MRASFLEKKYFSWYCLSDTIAGYAAYLPLRDSSSSRPERGGPFREPFPERGTRRHKEQHMAITKHFFKTKPQCRVTFALTAEEAGYAQTVSLVGDFNDWNAESSPMKKDTSGNFSLTLTLPVGGTCKFRYLADGADWLNDPEADGYEFCSFACSDNSILTL